MNFKTLKNTEIKCPVCGSKNNYNKEFYYIPELKKHNYKSFKCYDCHNTWDENLIK